MSCRAAQVYLGGGLELTVYRDGRAAIEAGCTLECGRCYYRSDCFHRLEVKEPDRAWHLVAAFWPSSRPGSGRPSGRSSRGPSGGGSRHGRPLWARGEGRSPSLAPRPAQAREGRREKRDGRLPLLPAAPPLREGPGLGAPAGRAVSRELPSLWLAGGSLPLAHGLPPVRQPGGEGPPRGPARLQPGGGGVGVKGGPLPPALCLSCWTGPLGCGIMGPGLGRQPSRLSADCRHR